MRLTKNFILAFILILVGITSRFIFVIDGTSWLPNFSAVGAVALFGATYFKGQVKWIVPLMLLWISDLVLNNVVYAEYYEGFQLVGSYWVYGSFLLTGLIGYLLLKNPSWVRLIMASISAGIIFFLITNFGSWITLPIYTKDFSGLMAAYYAGIPFFINTVLGNLIYGFLLFGIFEAVAHFIPDLDPVIGQREASTIA